MPSSPARARGDAITGRMGEPDVYRTAAEKVAEEASEEVKEKNRMREAARTFRTTLFSGAWLGVASGAFIDLARTYHAWEYTLWFAAALAGFFAVALIGMSCLAVISEAVKKIP